MFYFLDGQEDLGHSPLLAFLSESNSYITVLYSSTVDQVLLYLMDLVLLALYLRSYTGNQMLNISVLR